MMVDTETRKHDIRVMKNITITLDEELAAWARVEAAKAGKSMSRYIGDRLAQEMRNAGGPGRPKTTQREALDKFLSLPGWPGITKDLPSREELYAERLFHRHKSTAVSAGPKRPGKSAKSRRVANRSR
jgi:hypothetical protein